MAKQRTGASVPLKSDVIRDILKSQPKATVKEIKEALQQRGVKASDALINKLKYRRKRRGGKTRATPRRASAHGTKAEAIRNMFDKLGANARARDVVATLAARGIVVSSSQVSTLRKAKPRRGVAKSTAASSVPFDHLLAAKTLAARLGGINVAQRALESLARLIES